jgi:hypothetical protein
MTRAADAKGWRETRVATDASAPGALPALEFSAALNVIRMESETRRAFRGTPQGHQG